MSNGRKVDKSLDLYDPLHEVNNPEPGHKGKRQCVARSRRTGERCGKSPINGMSVCRFHGGAAPQAQAKAKLRLANLTDPAIATLARLMATSDKDQVKLNAANSILDRAGYGRQQVIEVEDARDLVVERILELRERAVTTHEQDS